MRIDDKQGGTRFETVSVDFSQIPWERSLVDVRVGDGGTTYAIIVLTNVPADRIHSSIRFTRPDERMLHWPVDLETPPKARLKLRVFSDNGEPSPAMVSLRWNTARPADVPLAGAIDLAPQFEAQGTAVSLRRANNPGLAGEYWCLPAEPVDMMISPGDYTITVRRGIEHVPIREGFTAEPGAIIEKAYTVARWVDMRRHGWYSGDDHVHSRILSDDDARRLMTWIKAEDIHVANVVKMGDIYRTWFEQRGFGRDYRVIDGDYILSPGQECPRTHAQIGHTLSLNITSMVRDTDRYYSYDWVARTVHGQGGLWGYAHVNSDLFFVHRDMSMNVPAGNVDFAEVLQFNHLGTDLYYDFLNLGFKITASAGSDVPWGGTVGEVRMYARVDPKDYTADAWFEAVRQGHTFVTNGPMIEFTVDGAIPGDELTAGPDQKLKVKARAWGDPARMLPIRLEIIRHGQAIKSIKSEEGQKEAALEFEVEAGDGFWIAARAEARNGAKAHTSPIYVVREGLRFWKYDAVEELIAKRLDSLAEVENIVKEAKDAVAQGGLTTEETGDDRAIRQLAIQGDTLLERVEKARQAYDELKAVAEKEREVRGQDRR